MNRYLSATGGFLFVVGIAALLQYFLQLDFVTILAVAALWKAYFAPYEAQK